MFAPPRRIRIINHTSHRLSSSDFNFPMPRASMPAAQHQTADKTTSTEDLDASQRTPCTLLTKGCNSNGKNDLTRGTSLEPQASLNLLNTSDGASRRHAASFGDLAPRSTIRRASLAQVQVSAHQASSSSRSREQHCQHGSWTESTSQAIPLQEGQKSSGSRYFAELVRRRQMQMAAVSAAAKSDRTRLSSPEHRASRLEHPRDMPPRSRPRRASLFEQHTSRGDMSPRSPTRRAFIAQIAADSSAAKSDGTRLSSPERRASLLEQHVASPRDMPPRSRPRRHSLFEQHAVPRDTSPRSPIRRSPIASLHASTTAASQDSASTERHGTPVSTQSNQDRLKKSSGGSRYSAELVRRRETRPIATSAKTDSKAPLVVTKSAIFAAMFGVLFLGLMTMSVSMMMYQSADYVGL